jgi:hypothetical protein
MEYKFRAWDEKRKEMIHFGLFDVDNPDPLRSKPIMQFTGLRDSKRTEEYPEGQEIWAGDIWKEENSIGIIVFKEGAFKIEWKVDKDFFNDILYIHANSGEVVGSIYDNPELLEGIEN